MTSVDIELVVTDLDGTLWDVASDLPERTRRAVARFTEEGIPLLVATGRRVGSTKGPLADFGFAPPAVVLNGALGLDLATGDRFHHGGFSAPDAAIVLEVFQSQGIDPCVYVDHDEYAVAVSSTPSSHPDHLAGFGADVRTDDLARVVQSERVLGFSVLGIPETTAAALDAALAGLATPHLDRDRYYGNFALTAAPTSQSKWDGVVSFCATHGLDADAVLVAGDGPNDVEMLEKAAIAVVPQDGHPRAQQLADHVIGRAADGGWADILDLLGH
ncbi:MAG TPA: HAD family hydrolase [Acidimicrobiales bacterium]|nr:HAD family hydrolase [Acidimicrobiales bacterium]